MMSVMPLSNYKEIIRHCFALDQDLLEKWHLKSGEGLNKCVEQTYRDMKDANVFFNVVHNEKDLVGYFGKEITEKGYFLTGFFVLPKYRTSEDLSEFWSLVRESFPETFYCGLYQKNEPAIDFITRNNGEPVQVVRSHGEVGVIYRIAG